MLPLMVQLNYIFTPQTQMSSPLLWRYPELCENTLFVTRRGQHHRIIELKPIVETLGPEKIAALPAFHALSEATLTAREVFQERESFSVGRYLQKWIKQLSLPLQGLNKLLIQMKKLSQPLRSLSVCHISYDGAFSSKKQAKSNRLPPTQAVLRAHY